MRYVFFIFIFLNSYNSWADIHYVDNICSAAAVNNAINSASDGDIVALRCTGAETWSATVTIPSTKGITLQVQGGTNQGTPHFPLTVTHNSPSPAIIANIGQNNSLTRITGFKFTTTLGVTHGDAGLISITGGGTGKIPYLGGFRLDDNYFDSVSGNAIITVYSKTNGVPLYGVIDHNTMKDAWKANDVEYGPYGIQVWNDSKSGSTSCWGADGWTNPFTYGDKNFVFIENNDFRNTTSGKFMRHYISSEAGGRFVARYNSFTVNAASPGGKDTDLIEGHGYCLVVTNGTGTRGAEVYNNTFSGTRMGRVIMPRGGHWLIYNNTFNNISTWGARGFISLMEYRAGVSGMYGQCSTTSPCTSVLGEAAWHQHVTTNPSYYPLPQQVTNTYAWNNLYNGVNQSPSVDSRGDQSFYIKLNRDYFVSTSKPAVLSGYSSYTYPHPLVTETPNKIPNYPDSLKLY